MVRLQVLSKVLVGVCLASVSGQSRSKERILSVQRVDGYSQDWVRDVTDSEVEAFKKREDLNLLPCPFCGGDGEVVSEREHDHDGSMYSVCKIQCSACNASAGFTSTVDWTVEAWNKRLRGDLMRETQKTISQWANDTFGPASSNARVGARANEEMAELMRALTADDNHPKAAEEMADVVIVLKRLAERMGVDLDAEVDRKMEVNRQREWKLDSTGHGYHVRQKS